MSEKANQDKLQRLKKATNCQLDDIYECYKGKPAVGVLNSSSSNILEFYFHPMADESFFSTDIMDETYDKASR